MQGLEKYIKLTLEQALKEVARDTAEFLSQTVQADIYRKPESDYYARTYEFLKSITQSNVKRVGNNMEIEVYFDPDKINPYPVRDYKPDMFNAHMSLDGETSYGGKSIGEWLVGWLEEGYSGGVRPPQPPLHFIQDTREWLNEELNDILNKAFRRAGFEIQVR